MFKPKIGVQGTVIGWDDPWHPEASKKFMRTGEGKFFPSQDYPPAIEQFIALLKDFNVDFYMHHVMPLNHEIEAFISDMKKADMNFIIGNEYGNINGPYTNDTNRYDLPQSIAGKARHTGRLLGLLYDETEHLQLHPQMYIKDRRIYQWTDPSNKTLSEIERDIEASVSNLKKSYGDIELYSEHVFPLMYHIFARGGINPCPKLLKEEFQSVQLAIAVGAARQYRRKLGICVDLWGFDVGAWFTRLWGFPAHSPTEFESALMLAYYQSPDIMFVENIDALVHNKSEGFIKSEFGQIFEKFIKDKSSKIELPYFHNEAKAKIAVIRADDCLLSERGTFDGSGAFGSFDIKDKGETSSFFKVMKVLAHGKITSQGITYFNVDGYKFPAGAYERTEEALRQFPLINGVGKENETHEHPIFFPMNGVLVFDDKVDEITLGSPELIIICGSRVSKKTLMAAEKKVFCGACCIIASWLASKLIKEGSHGRGKWILIDDFADSRFLEIVSEFIGCDEVWTQYFGDYELRITNPSKDLISLEYELLTTK